MLAKYAKFLMLKIIYLNLSYLVYNALYKDRHMYVFGLRIYTCVYDLFAMQSPKMG